MSRILIVDDKEMMRDSVATTLARKGHLISTAAGGKAAIEKLAKRRADVVITDLQMPEMDGLQLLSEIRAFDEHVPVLFMTAYGTVETAVSAMKQGAYDYITKPFSGDELLVAVERAIEHHRVVKENDVLRAVVAGRPGRTAHEFIGSGPVMKTLVERLERIAGSHGTVLVSGESGAGKEVAARRIHECSPRAAQPFLAINCAALSTSLLESELFGHEKGAFTGADRLRKGRFELADGGTLLLDEISEIASPIQAKLLRVLQEQSFERVGSSLSLAVDVRVIATTNRNLAAEVAAGRFRQDLYYRLNVLPLHMPALREHAMDIRELAAHFLGEVARREGRATKSFEPAAIERLERYPWPGNVRELQNVCERAAVLTDGDVIPATVVGPWLGTAIAHAIPATTMVDPATNGGLGDTADMGGMGGMGGMSGMGGMGGMSGMGGMGGMGAIAPATGPAPAFIEAKPVQETAATIVCDGDVTLDDIEREVIIATLVHHSGHRQKSAKALGIGVRTLGLKLKKWKEQQIVAQTL